ncbi:MAG: SRPBCC family protein [Planctomycetales bacterium]|nr:SRPBCC family protein [Planctomycetales bacterium]
MAVTITQIGKGYLLRAEQVLPRRREDVFPFFADAQNLETITPDWLKFSLTSRQPLEMREGLRIDYRLRLHGVPVRWRSEITAWEPPVRFIDEQRRGPYRYWIHEHRFFDQGDSTRMIDEVRYGLLCGAIINRLLVAGDLKKIFEFRERKLCELFSDPYSP